LIDLSTKIGSLVLKNPTILASGIMDQDAGSMKRIYNNGAGAIVTKSIGIKPNKGYSNPTFVELDNGILNAMGLPNSGIDNFKSELKKIKKYKIPIIGSIYGSKSEEFVDLSLKMENLKVDAVELNMSCPHAKGYGLEIGSDPSLIYDIICDIKNIIKIPIFVKISSNLTDIVGISKVIEDAGANGIVAINTIKAMKIDLSLKKPILSNKIGGYSGKAIKPIGIRCVYEIYKNVKIPIIGVGGITNGEDAIEYLMAGASSIQIGTGIYYRGIDIFNKICLEISEWMNNNNYTKISDLIGEAH
jgi:dihydroorotate dehydrogenase (NAD+) catalytic subunit